MKYIRNHKALNIILVVAIVFSILMTIYIQMTFEPIIDYQKEFENTVDYPWTALDVRTPLTLEEYGFKAYWGEDETKLYIQLFDNYFAYPPKLYKEVATIPQNVNNIQFDFTLTSPENIEIYCYIMQYSDNGRIEEATIIENISTDIIGHNPYDILSQNVSVRAAIHKATSYYKILFQIKLPGKVGSLSVQNIDILFN